MLCGTAFKNKGVQPLLDAVVDYLPSPLDLPPVVGVDPKSGGELKREANVEEPFSALAFKIMSDPFFGSIDIFPSVFWKIVDGVLCLKYRER